MYYPGSRAIRGTIWLQTANDRRRRDALSFQVRGGHAEAMAAAARVRLLTRATSLGGSHTYIEHRASIEGPGTKTPENLLRVSAGLENASDPPRGSRSGFGGGVDGRMRRTTFFDPTFQSL